MVVNRFLRVWQAGQLPSGLKCLSGPQAQPALARHSQERAAMRHGGFRPHGVAGGASPANATG
jgi:hypothetical protein